MIQETKQMHHNVAVQAFSVLRLCKHTHAHTHAVLLTSSWCGKDVRVHARVTLADVIDGDDSETVGKEGLQGKGGSLIAA